MTATPAQAQAVHAFIRQRIAGRAPDIAAGVRLLYGGSVKPGNAPELFAMPDIDGGLVGGAAFAIPQYLISNFHGPWLVDVVAAICSMAALAGFLRVWKPARIWTATDGGTQPATVALRHSHSCSPPLLSRDA